MPKLESAEDFYSDKPNKIDEGVYVSKSIVVRIENQSVHPRYKDSRKTVFKTGKPIELYLIVTYASGSVEKKMHLMGKYRKDVVTGAIKGWNPINNSVQDFLVTLMGKDTVEKYLEEDYSIKPKLLDLLIGKEFLRVSYVSGTYNDKPSYKDWRRVFSINTDIENIKEIWINESKYLKDYTPDVLTYFAPRSEEKKDNAEEDVI